MKLQPVLSAKSVSSMVVFSLIVLLIRSVATERIIHNLFGWKLLSTSISSSSALIILCHKNLCLIYKWILKYWFDQEWLCFQVYELVFFPYVLMHIWELQSVILWYSLMLSNVVFDGGQIWFHFWSGWLFLIKDRHVGVVGSLKRTFSACIVLWLSFSQKNTVYCSVSSIKVQALFTGF